MSENTGIHPKVKFFELFKVEADSLASQRVMYNEESDAYEYINTDVYGETVDVRIERLDHPQTAVLTLEDYDEQELVDELSELLASHNYDVDAFIQNVQKKYHVENDI